MTWHVALDIGGTFTDLVAFDDVTSELRHAKSSTTPRDLTEGIGRCLTKAKIPLESCETFVHGATIAINTLIEKTGARTVLLATAGARDAYLIGRGNRPEAYNMFFQRPEPLVPRNMILEVDERLSASGEAVVPLTDAAIARICDEIAAFKPEAIAVCLLHSYVNPAHEIALGAALRKAFPSAYISLSNEILRQYREYERTSTTVVNSYIGPRVSSYLNKLAEELKSQAFGGTLLIMQSNGGVTSVASAGRVPVALMESGPVGGINASAEFGKRLGFRQVIAFDMGGTTAKSSLIRDGEPAIAEGYYVGGYSSGHPVMLPVVDVVEVGAGGGSIGWIDEVGGLKVGPQSAGASPGPVCYAAGGTEPTLTDANLILGRIDPHNFLGGEMILDLGAARAAMKAKVAEPLGLTVEEAALGMLRISIAHMTLAVRGVSIERGYDPRDFVMVASGGNGGLHAPLIASELSIPKVIMPVLPAHFSAVGMLMTDIRHDYVRTHSYSLQELDFAGLGAIFDEFAAEGHALLTSEGVPAGRQEMRLSLDMRYIGQEYYLNVPIKRTDLIPANRSAFKDWFDQAHQRNYGQSGGTEPVEIVNARVSAHGLRDRLPVRAATARNGMAGAKRREVYLESAQTPVDCAIYNRAELKPAAAVEGPAIIEEDASTVLVPAGARATMLESGEILIDLGG
jgi:N-methylhydantoinase A